MRDLDRRNGRPAEHAAGAVSPSDRVAPAQPMRERVTSLSDARDGAREGAMRALAERLAGQKEALARRVVECWLHEIVDYRAPSDERTLDAEFGFAIENVDVLVARLESGRPVPDDHFE